jgi:hypothetical protein
MWIFTKTSFFSVVAYDATKDRNKASNFRNIAPKAGTHLLVRGRVEADFDALKPFVKNLEVEEDPQADYPFRAVVRRKAWKKFLAAAADDIDYDSHFKEVVRDNASIPDRRYSAMLGVWSAMDRLSSKMLVDKGFVNWTGGSSVARNYIPTESQSSTKFTLVSEPVGVDELVELLRFITPEDIDTNLLAELTPDAWELWLVVNDYSAQHDGRVLTAEELAEFAQALKQGLGD